MFCLNKCLYFERVRSERSIKTTQRRLSGGLYEIPAGVILVHVLFFEKSTPKSLLLAETTITAIAIFVHKLLVICLWAEMKTAIFVIRIMSKYVADM